MGQVGERVVGFWQGRLRLNHWACGGVWFGGMCKNVEGSVQASWVGILWGRTGLSG